MYVSLGRLLTIILHFFIVLILQEECVCEMELDFKDK